MTTSPPTLLVVEDDPITRTLLTLHLNDCGFRVLEAETLADMEPLVSEATLVILDMTLPDGSSMPILERFTEETAPPVICISSEEKANFRAEALKRGASDFIVKPVNETELVARIEKLLSGERKAATPGKADAFFDTDRHVLRPSGGEEVHLTSAESKLLKSLIDSTGTPLSRAWLTRAVFQRDWNSEDRSIDVLIGRVRKKLKEAGSNSAIVTVRQQGYRFDP